MELPVKAHCQEYVAKINRVPTNNIGGWWAWPQIFRASARSSFKLPPPKLKILDKTLPYYYACRITMHRFAETMSYTTRSTNFLVCNVLIANNSEIMNKGTVFMATPAPSILGNFLTPKKRLCVDNYFMLHPK